MKTIYTVLASLLFPLAANAAGQLPEIAPAPTQAASAPKGKGKPRMKSVEEVWGVKPKKGIVFTDFEGKPVLEGEK